MKIGFISKENAVRGLMAEAIAKRMLRDLGLKAEVYSAGLHPAREVDPLTLEVLKEKNYSTRGLYPKHISKIPYKRLDVLIILDPQIKSECEFVVYHKRRENWNIEPPSRSLQAFRKVRDQIEELIKVFLKVNS